MRHLYKSTSFVKTSIPIHSETSEEVFEGSFAAFSRDLFKYTMTFLQKFIRLACDNGKANSE